MERLVPRCIYLWRAPGEIYAKNVEIADAELWFFDEKGTFTEMHFFRHHMKKGSDVTTQIRYTNEHRTVIMYERNLVRVIMQRSRDDKWGPRTPPRS